MACGVAVFRELGLIETRSTEGGDRLRAIHVVNTESKVELTDSVRYREGLDEMDVFQAFCQWALGSNEQELRTRVCAPILPDEAKD